MSLRYRAHGLMITSDIALALPAADRDDPGVGDLVLRRGPDRPVPATDPAGDVLARVEDGAGRAFYSVARDGDRVRVRYPGLCEFVGDAGLREVDAVLAPGRDPGLLGVLGGGLLLALHLRLRGDLVLHASAVRVGAGALAFVGASGMGKSTLATLLCAAGRPLLTDDVLRAQLRAGHVVVHPGSTETRLRPGARALAETAVGGSRQTADGRIAVAPVARVLAPLPLRACVVPLPSREHAAVEVRRLSGARALMLLSRFPRIVGWREPTMLAREFDQLAELVGRVAVFEARVPWGPPFPPDLPGVLLAEIGLDAG